MSSYSRRAMLASAAAGIALVLAGCGSGDNSSDAGSLANPDQGASASAAKSWNDADVQFVQMMIPDHQMVAEMGTMAEKKATTADLKKLAKQMAGQGETVQMLTDMLSKWGKSNDMSGMQMNGGMSEQDMSMLKDMKKGMDFDMMFAQTMVKHHQASLRMAKDEQANGADPDAKAMAADMVKTLTTQLTALKKIADMSS
jgi:uncharacterized protein (DUF305 family)